MSGLISLMKVITVCGTALFAVFLILLSLPQSRLRSVALEIVNWGMSVGLALLTLSPIDVLPDVIPLVGWVDDLGYIVGTVCAVRAALRERRCRAALPE